MRRRECITDQMKENHLIQSINIFYFFLSIYSSLKNVLFSLRFEKKCSFLMRSQIFAFLFETKARIFSCILNVLLKIKCFELITLFTIEYSLH